MKLLCNLFRFLATDYFNVKHGNRRGFAFRHLQTCPDCRDYVARQQELTTRLRRHAIKQTVNPPPFLQARIMNSLVSVSPKASPSSLLQQATRYALPLLLLSVGFGWVVVQNSLLNQDFEQSNSEPAAIKLASKLKYTAGELNGQKLLELGQTLDKPLQTELDMLVKDALNAANGLASNFLPSRQ